MRFAEAVNRLDLTQTELGGLPELQERVPEQMAKGKVEQAKEKPKQAIGHAEEKAEGTFEG